MNIETKPSVLEELELRGQIIGAKISRATDVFDNVDKPEFALGFPNEDKGRLRLDISLDDPAQFIDNVLRVANIKRVIRDVSMPRYRKDLGIIQLEISRVQEEEEKFRKAAVSSDQPEGEGMALDFPTEDQLAELQLVEKLTYREIRLASIDGDDLTISGLNARIYGARITVRQESLTTSSVRRLRTALPQYGLELPTGLVNPKTGEEIFKLVWKNPSLVNTQSELDTAQGQVGSDSEVNNLISESPSGSVAWPLKGSTPEDSTPAEVAGEDQVASDEEVAEETAAPIEIGIPALSERAEARRLEQERKLEGFKSTIWSIFVEIRGKNIPQHMGVSNFNNFAKSVMNRKVRPEEVTAWAERGYLSVSKNSNPVDRVFGWPDMARVIYFKRIGINFGPDLNLFLEASNDASYEEWKAEQEASVEAGSGGKGRR